MKKVLVLLMLAGLILFPAISTRASVNIYVDTMGDIGNYYGKQDGRTAFDEDLQLTFAGIEYCTDQWKIAAEGGWGSFDSNDYDLWDLKFGYKVFESESLKLDLTASYASIDDTDSNFGKTEGFSLGADFIFILGDKATTEVDFAYAINPEINDGYFAWDDDVKMYAAKVKYNYMFGQNWGASLGYRYRVIDADGADVKVETKGFTVGLNYRF